MSDKANKIIQGMKEAIAAAKCDHDWQTENITGWQGHMRIVEHCWICGSRQTRFENANQ